MCEKDRTTMIAIRRRISIVIISKRKMEKMEEKFKLMGIKIEPESSLIQEGVKIMISFGLSVDLKPLEWTVRYTVDVAYKRKILELYKETVEEVKAGNYTKEFILGAIDLSAVPNKDIMNIGLLSICGVQAGQDVFAINMVSQITKNENNEFVKTLLSPLE